MTPRRGLTADQIARAAADLADEAGLDQLTAAALARRLGVRDASLYSHVRNLQEIRVRVALLAAEEMTERIGIAVAGRSGKDALVAFADAYRDYALEHPGRYAATQQRLDPAQVADSVGGRRSFELTQGMLRAYGLDDPDVTDAGRLLRSTFHGFAALQAGGGFGDPRDIDASWRRVLDALHFTLEHWKRTT